MSDAWRKIDLEGGGLQAANQRLAALLRSRRVAYLLWLLFPLGAHRVYLDSRPVSLVYAGLTALSIILWFAFHAFWAWLPLATAGLLALYDLVWIDRRVVELNKQLRMEVYMGMGAQAPKGYKGRYPEGSDEVLEQYVQEKERERAGVQPVDSVANIYGNRTRMPSLAEQEALLREQAKRKKEGKEPPEGEQG